MSLDVRFFWGDSGDYFRPSLTRQGVVARQHEWV